MIRKARPEGWFMSFPLGGQEGAVRQAIIAYRPEQFDLDGMLWMTKKVNESCTAISG